MKTYLDWSAYEDAGMGDAYADIPKTGGNFAKAVAVCINSKACERRDAKGVMCPSYRVSGDTNLSTGGRVQLLKAALNGEPGGQPFADPTLGRAMDLCVSCKGCKRECENAVDMTLIKTEYLAHLNEHIGLSLRARWFAHLPVWLHRWPWLRRPIEWRNGSRLLARLGERALGIAAARRLPVPAAQPFAENAAPAGTGREVVLFVDTFGRHFEPDIPEAALAVLKAAGYNPIVAAAPPGERPLCCGRTYLAQGMVSQAQAEARRMLETLLPHIRAGRTVVGLEPSCLLTLRDEYKALGLGADAAELAAHALLFEEFLAREHANKNFDLAFKPLPAHLLVHGHCHQKAAGAMKSMRKILKLIPDLSFEPIESSCCGMAGSFGLEAEHAALSRDMAELGLLPALRARPDDRILGNGFSCRQQIRETDGRSSLHLAQLLRAQMQI